MAKVRLSREARNWVEDRIENEEPLLWSEFLKLMKEMGETAATIKRYRSKAVKNAAKKRHKEGIAFWKMTHRLGSTR